MLQRIVSVAVGMYLVVYIFVPALQQLVNVTIAGTIGTMVTTVLPALGVIGVALLFIPRK